MSLLIAVGHRLHELDASLQRRAANQPGHSERMYKSHLMLLVYYHTLPIIQ